jgi:TatD DNase family protein
MIYVDSHIHLYDESYKEILEEVIREARENKIKYILSVSEDYSTSFENMKLKRYDILVGLGVHPWTAIYRAEEIDKTIDLIIENIEYIDAIGEVGLDRKYRDSDKFWDREVKVFKKMIYLAKEYGKTLNIHSRKAAKDVLRLLYSEDVEKAYLHWFTDDIEILKEAIDMGYYIGFTPSVLYSKRIQKMVSTTPLEKILTETDGPVRFYGDLRHEVTRPIHVKLVVDKIAKIKDLSSEEVAEAIADNFYKLFIVK